MKSPATVEAAIRAYRRDDETALPLANSPHGVTTMA